MLLHRNKRDSLSSLLPWKPTLCNDTCPLGKYVRFVIPTDKGGYHCAYHIYNLTTIQSGFNLKNDVMWEFWIFKCTICGAGEFWDTELSCLVIPVWIVGDPCDRLCLCKFLTTPNYLIDQNYLALFVCTCNSWIYCSIWVEF